MSRESTDRLSGLDPLGPDLLSENQPTDDWAGIPAQGDGLDVLDSDSLDELIAALAASDRDDDGRSDLEELLMGNDPDNPCDGPDRDGDGILNGEDADVDGDGFPNGSDFDMDGDDLANEVDDDDDGDGVLDWIDNDDDADGKPDDDDDDDDDDTNKGKSTDTKSKDTTTASNDTSSESEAASTGSESSGSGSDEPAVSSEDSDTSQAAQDNESSWPQTCDDPWDPECVIDGPEEEPEVEKEGTRDERGEDAIVDNDDQNVVDDDDGFDDWGDGDNSGFD